MEKVPSEYQLLTLRDIIMSITMKITIRFLLVLPTGAGGLQSPGLDCLFRVPLTFGWQITESQQISCFGLFLDIFTAVDA